MYLKKGYLMKKIAIIGIVGVPACYGGFESLVENLLNYTPPDVEYIVFCSKKRYDKELPSYKGAKLKYINLDANGKSSMLYDFLCMMQSLKSDAMVLLGNSGSWSLPFIRKIYKGKIITNVDGIEWERDKWSKKTKKIIRHLVNQSVKYSDVLIGDNKGITDFLLTNYNKKAELIAYGGDQATIIKNDSLFITYPFCKEKYAISVCRIEPENNIHIILEAFSLQNKIQLLFIGNWENSEYGKNLKKIYSEYSHLHLLNPIYDTDIINWLRCNATLYIHGHSAGGTNPSLVEAMNLRLPVLAYDCVYNRATTENKALYWKDKEDIINQLNIDQVQCTEIAAEMYAIAEREYTWKRIAEKYNSLY